MIFRARALARRPAAAAVELAVLAPFLAFLFVLCVDWARIFYYSLVLENCARNGAYYASDYGIYDYNSASDAALEDATNLSPAPTVATAYSTNPTGPYNLTSPPSSYINGSSAAYVQVTMTWTFNSVVDFSIVRMFQIPTQVTLQRSVDMQMAPIIPYFSNSNAQVVN